MKLKISTRDLKIGMYVYELDRPWRETPFLFQGFEVRTEKDLQTLRQYCRDVFILQDPFAATSTPSVARRDGRSVAVEPVKGAAEIQFQQQLLKINNHPTARSIYEDKTTIEQEIELVAPVYREVRSRVEHIFEDVRLGRSVDDTVARRSVSQLADSVLRNPDALTCYALLKRKDDYSALHGLRCCILTLIFGRQLGMAREQLEILGMAGLLHDIGMIKVPDEILNKPTPLTPVEMSIVRRHVNWGGDMLDVSHGMPPAVIEAARRHHENYDGTGYMNGLRGDSIGDAGLITAIVDYYDAVTSDRIYHLAASPYAAMHAMYEGRGTRFHPELIESFIQCLGIYPVGSVVALNTGEIGVVVALNRATRLRPRVALVRQPDKTLYPLPPVINLVTRRTIDGELCEIERILDPRAAEIDPVRYLPVSAAAI